MATAICGCEVYIEVIAYVDDDYPACDIDYVEIETPCSTHGGGDKIEGE